MVAVGVQVVALRWEQPQIASEYINLFHADRLASGEGLYTDPGPGTWSFPVYFPGLYALLAPLTWVTGPDEIWLERLAALIALIGVCLISARTALRISGSRIAATVSGLGLLGFVPVAYLVGVVRPDVFALVFAAGALAAVTRWEDERDGRWLIFAALCCAAMVLTRQVYAPIAAALILAVLLRDPRAGLRTLATSVGATLVVLAITELASGGSFSADIRAFTDLLRLSSLTELIESQLWPPNPLYLVGALGCAAGFRRGILPRGVHLAWLGGAICCLAAVKVGSSGNYLLPLMWASAILCGPALELTRARISKPAFGIASVAVTLLLISPAIDAVERAEAVGDLSASLNQSQEEASERIAAIDGPLLGDRFDLALAAGRHPDFEALLLSQLEVTGVRTPTELARAVRRQRFEGIQVSFDLFEATPSYQGLPYWPPSVVAAARASYCERWQGDFVWLYRPCRS